MLFMYSENDLPVSETDHLAVLSSFLPARKTQPSCQSTEVITIKD